MGRKRKRPVKDNPTRAKSSPQQPSKISPNHLKTNGSQAPGTAEISHPVISLYYRQVVTLRQYILQRIPRSSKSRRRRIAAVRSGDVAGTLKDPGPVQTQNQDLAHILDTTLVGIWEELPPTRSQARRQDLAAFSQAQSAVASQLGTDTGPASPQSEVVDFVIASVFAHRDIFQGRPEDKHLLSHGYRRASRGILCTIPNVESYYPNKNVRMLKQSPWPEVLALLGGNGDEIMLKLLLDCGLFVAVDAKKGVYCQISGLPLSGLQPIRASPEKDHANGADKTSSVTKDPAAQGSTAQGPTAQTRSNTKHSSAGGNGNRLKPNAIVFCRQRMLYARPQLGIKGKIVFGLPNHVLSRFPSSKSLQHTVHVMKYVFPRQFGLHNVCKAWSNYRDNPLFKNYSSREDEIASKEGLRLTRHQQRADTGGTDWVTSEQQGSIKIPRRLRGRALELVRQLQNRHRRCFYNSLLRYYCSEQLSDHCTMGPPSTESEATSTAEFSGSGQLITQPSVAYPDTQNSPRATNMLSTTNSGRKRKRRGASRPKVNLTDHATPAASISAFCRAVIQNLVPAGFFGTGEQGAIHQNIILRHVDRFIHMRRRESLSLHEICAGIKITQIPWLEPHNFSDRPSEDKISASDLQKRRELFHEFLYYLFDSILLPLIRGNFYVTESQVHRQRLFYFRHDVWRRLTTQPLANLRASMFEELTPIKAQELLCSKKSLGYGSLRLLPKLTGIRPIMNLKRPTQVKSGWGRQARYSYVQSVNSAIAPVHNMLNYEKTRRGDILGSGMLSVKDIHSQLKGFKKSMVNRGLNSQTPLYFVKLDIQSCFDTIPQQSLVRLIEKLVSEEEYNWMKYVEMCPRNEFGDMWQAHNQGVHSKPWRKFAERFASIAKPEHLADAIAGAGVVGKRNSVFIDTTTKKKNYSSEGLLDVLNEHVQNTLVKIGKKLFRQRNGIPQGSVMSSLLCNLFYAEMERNELGFLQTDDALFLRYVDDFLLITLDSGIAMDFLRVMLRGQPTYGVSVNPTKSLVNFAASVGGMQIPRLVDTSLFPYCGCLIETRTLDIFKDQNRMLDGAESAAAALSDSLVVDSARNPGRFFHQKVLGSVKQSLHPMYTDTAHNSLHAVLLNIFKALVGAAMKMYRYTRSLPARAHPRPEVVVRTVRDAMQLGYRLIRGQHERCKVTYHQMQYLGAAAFQFVLGRKQTRYAGVLCWLDGMMTEALESSPGSGALLAQVVRTGNLTYGGWRF